MAVSNIYPVITPMIKVSGGTSGPGSTTPTDIFAVIGGSDGTSGIPATGGGGGGTGVPLIFGRVSLILSNTV